MNILSKPKRKVRRVLLMVEWEDAGQEGDVFDLTALVGEMHPKSKYNHAELNVSVRTEHIYGAKDAEAKFFTHINFGGDAGEWVSGATHIEDVVNFMLPDDERVKAIKAKSAKLSKKIDELRSDAMHAKLLQVAAVRHQHPIARFTLTPEVTPKLV